jgi:hypothetical protein
MKVSLHAGSILLITLLVIQSSVAQQRTTRVIQSPTRTAQPATMTARQVAPLDNDSLLVSRQSLSQPVQRTRIASLGNASVRNGDNSTVAVRDIVVQSFQEQEGFASRMNKAELVDSQVIAALPEVEDEVLVFDDAYVIRRSTRIIVVDPVAVAKESSLFRSFLDQQPIRSMPRKIAGSPDLSSEEKAGLQQFMSRDVNRLHPDDPLRAATASGEQALLDAIAAGQGEFIVEDTLIIPKEMGTDQGQNIAIPTIRNGVMDLKNPEPVKSLAIKGMGPGPDPVPPQSMKLKVQAIPEASPPPRAGMKPKSEATGKKKITAEFLLGTTRAANFQWERKWTFPSGFFRLTLGSGYVFGYRVPVIARATVEPARGYIQDYSDKKVIIGAEASVKTTNGDSKFYQRAGLSDNQIKKGNELLLEANVGYGYKFRALWTTIRHRPYSAIGISYSQSFKPPMDASGLQSSSTAKTFAMTLDPKTTKISVEGNFVGGSAIIRFDGRAWGTLTMDLETLVDNRTQKTFAIKTNQMTAAGSYPFKLVMNPVPLRQGTTIQHRPFGIRLVNPAYQARFVVTPKIRFGFRVGYKKLSRNFTTSWIPLNSLTIDTGNFSMKPHAGTRTHYTWNEGEKIYRKIQKPDSGPAYTTENR